MLLRGKLSLKALLSFVLIWNELRLLGCVSATSSFSTCYDLKNVTVDKNLFRIDFENRNWIFGWKLSTWGNENEANLKQNWKVIGLELGSITMHQQVIVRVCERERRIERIHVCVRVWGWVSVREIECVRDSVCAQQVRDGQRKN